MGGGRWLLEDIVTRKSHGDSRLLHQIIDEKLEMIKEMIVHMMESSQEL